LKTGALELTRNLFIKIDNEQTHKNQGRHDRLHVSATILAQWWHQVASTKALDLFYQALSAVLYQCTAAAIKMASKVGTLFCHCFVCCCPGGRWGSTEQVVARWRHPVASRVAMDMLHQAIPSVLLQCTAMAIKMANDRGTL
jgi:hypothetical protein